ncbi:hypothetical protein E1A91_D10G284200v1 [Gossypium mustelinum]|uniref:Uncharacterized protein n=1 Tax=Gossypium mustelinum TaxID=34275 RepID=A0A5D2TC78_GOSMU|nr:hypothetical protein E1A91_D10G284200v1 [Gossypium mustelinum]
MISGKTVSDSSFTLELVDNNDFYAYRKSSNGAKGPNHERKKGIPWTIEEHRLFLLGIKKYGKGDWRNISTNFVDSKTPTQVASHAQKYHKWKLSRGKDEKKPGIHDVTVLDLTGTTVFSDDRKPPSANQSNVASQQKPASTSKTSPNDGSATVFGLVNGQYVKSRL